MRSGYVGPAPVPLADYGHSRSQAVSSVQAASRAHRCTTPFAASLIEPALLDQLGPALSSGRAHFHLRIGRYRQDLHRPNGLPARSDGLVLRSRTAIAVNETVVRVFDPQSHLEVAALEPLVPSLVLLDQGPRCPLRLVLNAP